MAENDQVNPSGDQGNQVPGWISGLPDEFKNHEYLKTFQKPGDFVKTALGFKSESEALKTKLGDAIFKPGENATDEEKTAYYKALGVPEKPTDYEFAKAEGIETDPKMVEWAQGLFKKANLTKEQGQLISAEWNGFVKGLTDAQVEANKAEEVKIEAARNEAETKLKTEWGAEYDGNVEFVKRGFKKFSNEEFNAFVDRTGIGNDPGFIKFIYNVGKTMGEDFSPRGGTTPKPNKASGFQYDMPDFSKGG